MDLVNLFVGLKENQRIQRTEGKLRVWLERILNGEQQPAEGVNRSRMWR